MAFRKIIVDGKVYLWKYSFDDYDYQQDSFVVVKTANRKGKLIIQFRTGKWDFGYCPFNKGVPAVFQKEPVTINLNQPRFIAELISAAFNHLQITDLSGNIELNNGLELLHEIGYAFDYQKQGDGTTALLQ